MSGHYSWGKINRRTGKRHPKACKRCVRNDRPYGSNGYCTSCNSRVNFSKVCKRCNNAKKPYYAKGYCRSCYNAANGYDPHSFAVET